LLGIAVALPAEAHPLRRAYADLLQPCADGTRILLEVTGMGAVRARAGARRLVEAGAAALLSWGTAAGLEPGLRPGAIALPEIVIDGNGRRFQADAAWHRRMLKLLEPCADPITAPLAVSPVLLRGPDEKQALHRHSGASFADMESGAIAEVAREAGIPFLSLRAVLDPAAGIVPGCVIRAADAQGRLPLARLAAWAAVRPGDWAHLVSLARWFGEARRALARVAHQAGPRRLAWEPL
jgi:adenosylhomocysteine nucleosidase